MLPAAETGLAQLEAHACMETSDADLLEKIALQRDRNAYTELCARVEQPAFNLACHLTSSRELAEEVVQEALLDIWLAPPAQCTSAQGWIMRMVAHKSIDLLQKRRRERNRVQRLPEEMAAPYLPPAAALEHEEVLAALRKTLARLPVNDRCLLALYYGAALSQEEIGKSLDMPQRTVSLRIQQVLETLHASLAKAGFTSAALVLTSEGLRQALCAGLEMPAGLHAAVASQALHPGAAKASASLSARAVGFAGLGSASLVLAGIAAAAVAAGAMVWSLRANPAPPEVASGQEAPAVAPPLAPPAMVPPLTALPPPAPPPPLSRSWDFNSAAQAEDFTVTRGAWRYIPDGGQERSGCMESETDAFFAEIKFPLRKLPVLVTFLSRPLIPIPKNGPFLGVGWAAVRTGAQLRNIGAPPLTTGTQWFRMRNFVGDGFIDYWCENQRTSLGLYTLEPETPNYLLLVARGKQRIDSFSIREIEAAELPDVSKFLAAVEKIEPSKRVGKVLLPEFKSSRPPQPALVEFMSTTEAESKE